MGNGGWRPQYDQNYRDCVQRTCNLIVASKIGNRSATAHTGLLFSNLFALWRWQGDR